MVLQIGSRGSQVRSLQRALEAQGFETGGVDGVFGANTDRAVRAYQDAKQLEIDGKVGTQTRTKLFGSDTFTPPVSGTTPGGTRPGELPYRGMQRFAESRGFHVTSSTGGRHLGRAHHEGRAIDVRTRDHTRAQVDQFIRDARAAGYTVIDERRGGNSAWTGPHIHLQVP